MRNIQKLIVMIEKAFINLSALLILVLTLFIVTDVILRATINKPISGLVELTGEFFLVSIIYLGVSFVQQRKEHINVDLLLNKISINIRKICDVVIYSLSIIIFSILSYSLILKTLRSFNQNITSVGPLAYPLAPAYFIIFICMVLLILRLLLDLISVFSKEHQNI